MKKSPTISLIILFSTFLLKCGDKEPTKKIEPCYDCPIDFNITDYEPSWSPDGKYIAFIHGDSIPEKTGIYLFDLAGNKVLLWHVGNTVQEPTWSADGQWIAFSEDAQIWKKKITGDSLVQLTDEGRNFFPSWSPDGKWIAHTQSVCNGTELCGLWLFDATTRSDKHQVLYGTFPSWHPSSKRILFETRAVLSNGAVIGDSLWLYNLESNNRDFLLALGGKQNKNTYLKYSPTADKILFTSQAIDGNPQIWVINLDGTGLAQLTENQAYSCDWSQDGTKVVYTDSRPDNGRLWLMNADGSAKQQLTFKTYY